jgi:hypothetical protein
MLAATYAPDLTIQGNVNQKATIQTVESKTVQSKALIKVALSQRQVEPDWIRSIKVLCDPEVNFGPDRIIRR